MGNETSQLNGLEIEEDPTETTDFWSHYQATISDSCRYFSLKSDGSVSVFRGEAAIGPLWVVSSPLEKYSNNLMKYRHPCIVKYISAWQQRNTYHLATEYVQPLAQVLSSQTPLQICIGLNNILRALVFLHEQAGMSHNNISISAIYVTGDGQWKLGGLQYLCSFKELSPTYLKHSRIHRYDKAVDPNEDSYDIVTKVDQYSYASLVEDAFKHCTGDDVPYLREFTRYCKESLQHHQPTKRPNLSEVFQHNFFNHEFITIHKFLTFLPLKTEEERNEFFTNILVRLKCYDEETVAKQLGGMLLSRLTMLDQTAQRDVIPFILKPKHERAVTGEHAAGFFSLSIFKEHVKPRLMQLFSVRDSQIRKLLLTHFTKFVHVFSHDELSQNVLPELLLGIKDNDDELVASTLICLSELVPILGADVVVGGKRSKLFTDGRPYSKSSNVAIYGRTYPDILPQNKSLTDYRSSEALRQHNNLIFEKSMALNERPSPVGGESIEEEKNRIDESEEDWSDWENSAEQKSERQIYETIDNNIVNIDHNLRKKSNDETESGVFLFTAGKSNENTSKITLLQKAALQAKKNIVDISELDIKNQKIDSRPNRDELDYFADMIPVIEKQIVNLVGDAKYHTDFSSKLDFVPDDGVDENEGWGDNWNE